MRMVFKISLFVFTVFALSVGAFGQSNDPKPSPPPKPTPPVIKPKPKPKPKPESSDVGLDPVFAALFNKE